MMSTLLTRDIYPWTSRLMKERIEYESDMHDGHAELEKNSKRRDMLCTAGTFSVCNCRQSHTGFKKGNPISVHAVYQVLYPVL